MSFLTLLSKQLGRRTPSLFSLNNIKLSRIAENYFSVFSVGKTIQTNGQFLNNCLLNRNVLQKRNFGNHGLLWNIERLVYLCMAVVIPLGIAMPSQNIDNAIAVLTTAHLHWGMEAIAIDYVRPVIFGPLIPKIFMLGLFLFSCATLALLLDYNMNNKGITASIRRTWEITGK